MEKVHYVRLSDIMCRQYQCKTDYAQRGVFVAVVFVAAVLEAAGMSMRDSATSAMRG
jgi:hypothetical protein